MPDVCPPPLLPSMTRRVLAAAVSCLGICLGVTGASAGPLRDLVAERRSAATADTLDASGDVEGAASSAALPAGVRRLADIAYGAHPAQRMDVYLPPPDAGQGGPAPVVFMVHGGGWRHGDKRAGRVVDHKLARWAPRGAVFVSVNYRLQAGVTPLQQSQDVALALVTAQGLAASWGADPGGFILMGHSAGAHLVALLNAAPPAAPARPWLGAVALDSAAMDVPLIMNARHFPLYDRAFGADPAAWAEASPYHRLVAGAAPLLMVCSSRRNDSCAQAGRLQGRAQALGGRADVLPQPLPHGQINETLGQPSAYTSAVEAFMASLGGEAARAFGAR